MDNKTKRYIKEYKWSDIFAMLRNNKKEPLICNEVFKNQLVVITGATSGIGREAAYRYAAAGADIISINRDKEKSEKLSSELISKYNISFSYFIADLSIRSEMNKAAEFLDNIDRDIDVLIINAGVFNTKRKETIDGLEEVFAINYLSGFIITQRLIKKFKDQNHGRIIYVNSEGHRFAVFGLRLDDLNWKKRRYSGLASYGSAKTAQLLSMIKFNKIFSDSDVTINAMHPGAVKSNTGKTNGKLYKWYKTKILEKKLKPTDIASEALYFLGVSESIKNKSGLFFNLTTVENPTPPALDSEVAEELYSLTLEIAGFNDEV